MHLIIFAAILLAPFLALLAVLAFFLVRVDCYGGIRILGFNVGIAPRKWTIVAHDIIGYDNNNRAIDWNPVH